MGTNTTRRRGVVRVWFRCGSGTAAQAADAVHARLQQHAQGRDGEQYEVRPTSANKPTTTGVEESQEHASAGRDAVGKQGMQQKSVTVPGPSRLRASISVANGPRSILGYYDAARLRRCYIQTAHTLLEKSRKEMGWHGAWGGEGGDQLPSLGVPRRVEAKLRGTPFGGLFLPGSITPVSPTGVRGGGGMKRGVD
jgi:hypothetical protein